MYMLEKYQHRFEIKFILVLMLATLPQALFLSKCQLASNDWFQNPGDNRKPD